MRSMYRFMCIVVFGLFVQAHGEVVFHDTFQAGDDTAPNANEELRQTTGLATSSYALTTYGDRSADNYHRIMDPESTGETALELGVHKPLAGVGAISWVATRTMDLSLYAEGESYVVTWDAQLRSGGGTPWLFDSDIAFGILGSTGPMVTPMTAESIFGVRLDADGGDFDIYSNGTNLYSSSTGSTLDWNERFELKFVVNETDSHVQVLLQGVGDPEAIDLGTYGVDFGSGGRIIQMYSSQTDNGSGGGGKLEAEVFELAIFTPLYVDDFGAVGDGVTDDINAVVNVLAALKNSPVGGTVEFSAGKIYKFGKRSNSNFQIDLQGMTNVTIEGNGAVLLSTPYRAVMRMQHCSRAVIRNFTIDQEPLGYTQGVITNVSPSGGFFDMKIMDGYDPLPNVVAWGWGSVIDPDLRRIRWDMRDHFRPTSYTDLGSGLYRGYVQSGYTNDLNNVRSGDIYFQPFNYNGSASNIHITNSKDCLLENMTLYSGRSSMSSRVDLNTGRITIRGFKVLVLPGFDRFVSNWRDGVHCKDNRIGPIIEDCYFEAIFDDSINLSQNTVMASEIISDTTFRMTKAEGPLQWTEDSSSMHVGDRIMVFYPPTGAYIGPIHVASVDPVNRELITFEAPVLNVVTGMVAAGNTSATHFYNLDMCNAGYVIRNNIFKPQRHHAMIVRGPEGLIEGNRIEGVGGYGILIENEYGADFFAGPFPQDIVVSNNIITSTRLTPIKVHASSGPMNTRLVKDIQIIGNLITTSNSPAVELINVQDATINANVFNGIDWQEMPDPIQLINSVNVNY